MLLLLLALTPVASSQTAMVFFEEGTGASIVDGDDSMWLQDAAVNRAVINIMLMFKGQPDIAHIRQIFADRLVAAVDGNNNGKVRRRRSKRAKVVITWICLF